jgi:hypothetical protein
MGPAQRTFVEGMYEYAARYNVALAARFGIASADRVRRDRCVVPDAAGAWPSPPGE